ncbi:hypothetical protein EV215_1498 [Hypnocyclicus thermotrophus]|uniref:UPF0122 protein EV215_1498 n=1 Tax=Hypnocyclicus thermotrophus TaxID=1627895 RepID=A0AA46DXY1_9FUSO|nr:sigma factor-like helix-turn-helix DNA-binding protein [Hypnocyclicus thermotrophus]TDT69156.1 hypothetical protein EV215_1498 [Hypnocyclicus thermotrophus]
MELKEFMETSLLLSYYKNLLSNRQKEYMLKHFEEDYSLSEIAKEYAVSRQAVYDNIKRGIKILEDYEKKLGFFHRDKKILSILRKIDKKYKIDEIKKIIELLEAQ